MRRWEPDNPMVRRSFKLTTVLSAITLGLLTLVCGVLALLSYQTTQQALQREMQRSFDNRNRIIELSISDTLDRASQKISDLARQTSFSQWSYAADMLGAEAMLGEYARQRGDSQSDILALIKPDRSILIEFNAQEQTAADQALALFAEGGELSGRWQLIVGQQSDRPVSALLNSVPIIEPQVGRVVAYIVYGILLSGNEQWANELRADADIEALELLVNDQVIASSIGEKALLEGRPVLNGVRLTEYGSATNRLAVRSFLPNNFQEELDLSLQENLIILLLVLVVGGLLALWLIRRITTVGFGRLLQFAEASRRDGVSVPYPGGLISDFNNLGHSLEQMVSSISDNQRYLDALLQESVSPLVIWDAEMRVVRINRATEELLDRPAEAFIGGSLLEVFAVATWKSESVEAFLQQVLEGDYQQSIETLFMHDDKACYLTWDMTPIRYRPKNEAQTYVAQGTDITDIRLAEIALKESEEQLRMLLNSTAEAIYGVDLQGNCTMANPACVHLLGYDGEEDLLGRNIDDLAHYAYPDGTPYPREAFRMQHSVMSGRGIHADHEVFWRRDGSSFPVEYWAFPIIRNGEVAGAVVSFLDISQRKAAEREIKDLRNYLKNIIDSMPSVLVGVDNSGVVTQWNREAERQTGVSADEAYGKALDEVLPIMRQEMQRVAQAIEERRVEQERKLVRRHDGENRYTDITVFPLIANGVSGAVIRLDDITDRVRLEELMIQSEKMMSVGGLAAGMAHEINNPLAGILQNMQVIDLRLSLDVPKNHRVAEEVGVSLQQVRDYMEARGLLRAIQVVADSGKRAARIVDNMLSFSRKSASQYAWIDFAELVEKTIELVSNDYDLKKNYDFRRIRIERDFEAELPKIRCEPSKIQQALLNLFKNGAHAMAGMAKQEKEPVFILRLRRDAGYLRLEVEDNGPGMEETVRKRIFEPFFTTKDVGEGTGLGLSVSYFLITEDHRGTMAVESAPGRGTTFIIRLPLQEAIGQPASASNG